MDAVYLATDIVVHPARVEPHGLVILETMNWSKVIISSDSCGASEDRVIHGLNGFSFPSGDVDELARIMLDLVHHPSRLPEVGAQARKTAEAWPVARGVEIVLEQAQKVLLKAYK
jgi:glycosyltransferase involved in cell wall biosynthesis